MPTIWTSRTRTRQPQTNARAARDDAIAQGLGSLFAFSAEGIVDIVGASGRQAASNFLRYQTKHGTGFGRSAAGSGQPLVASPFGSGAFSAVVLAAPTSTSTIKPWISWRDDGGGEQVTFMANADAGFGASAGAITMTTGTGIILSTASGVTGSASVYGFSVDGASAGTIYVDGVAKSTTVTGSGLLSATARPFYVGSHGGTGAVHGEPIYFILTAKRAWSAAEHAAIARNVWGRFAPVRKPVFYSLAGGGANTIAVPKGTLTLTGLAPTVVATANQAIAVPAGSLTMTGLAPTVIAGGNQTVAVPAGALTLTGLAPTVQNGANRIIDVPAGSLALTGIAPTISQTAHQYISVPKGALSLTGYAPTVLGGESLLWTPVTPATGTWTPV